LARFDYNGMLLGLIHQFGGTTNESVAASGVSGDSTGIYVVGSQGLQAASDVIVWKFDFDLNPTPLAVQVFGSRDAAGNNRGDIGNAISAGPNGVYIGGQINGQIFGELPLVPPTAFDAFIRKLDPDSLSELWTRRIRTSGNDNVNALAQDDTGVYAAGQVQGSLDGHLLFGAADAFIRKYDFSGNVMQTQMIQSSLGENALWVSTDGLGVYVSGTTQGVLPGQVSAGLADAFIIKYTTDLTSALWTLQFGSSQNDTATGISADALGLYVAGGTAGTLPGQTSAGANDAYVGSLVLKVGIDIKPGTFPNDINLGSHGTVAVVILGTSNFDVESVDPSTVTLAGAGIKIKNNGKLMTSLEDANSDGLLDLVVHFSIDDLQLTSSDEEAVLKGQTFAGDHIRGEDAIQVVP
jgi:hypothetical protein